MTNLLKTILVCVTLSTLSISSAYAGNPKRSPNNKPAISCIKVSQQNGDIYTVRNSCNKVVRVTAQLEKDGSTKKDYANIKSKGSVTYQGYKAVLVQSARYL